MLMLTMLHMLTLPLWFVTEHIHPTSLESTPAVALGRAFAFSSIVKLAAYKRVNRGGEAADDREGLVIVVADLHRLGIAWLLLDPQNDGTGGEQIPLSDLVALADSQ